METLSFGVPFREGHDNYLMSLAGYPRMGVAYAATTPPPPVSGVIPPEDRYQPRTDEQWDRVW